MSLLLKMMSISGLLSALVACGGGGGSDSTSAPQNNLTPTNLAPTISAPAALSVLEGINLSTKIATSDPNMDEVTLSLGQNSADSSLFSLDNTGQIRFKSLPDFENPTDADNDNEYQLTVIASDGSLSTAQSISVTVEDAFEGRVVDGPLAGAAFFVDLNGNETQDQGEPVGITDASGFISIPQFTITAGLTPRLISRGGTDTTTGIELPNLTLIAPLDADTASFKSITPLTTLLSAATNSSGHTEILRALGVIVSIDDALSLDAWSESLAGNAEAQALQRTNLQIGVLLNSAQTLLGAPTSTASESLSVTQSLSAEILRQAQTGNAIALTDANTLASIIVSAANSTSQTDAGQNGLLIGSSIATINSVIANATLNPTSETAQNLVATTQNQLVEAISDVNSGVISPEEFATNTSPEMLFSEISTPQNTPDTDNDGLGNSLDPDDDNDGILDDADAFPLDDTESIDTDSDGIGNNADTDDDNDGVLDVSDAFPLDAAESVDTDSDGIGNNTDTDDDNDGVLDVSDAFPLDAAESVDTDSDGIGNNADLDDDNDGVLDVSDESPLNPDVHILPVALSQSLSLNLASGTRTNISGSLTSTSQDSRPVTYTIVSTTSLGTLTLSDSASGAFTYQTAASTTGPGTDSFTFRVNDGFINSLDTTVPIAINGDPLYPFQWHLNNTGQTTFSDSGGITGEDLNVDSVTNAGTTGGGVIVAVVDEGLEIAHPDLVTNVVVNGSYDYVQNDSDPTNPSAIGDHGTSVAGIIAATGWNNIGGRGVAPEASLKGFNFLRNQSVSNEIDALGGASNAPSGDVDIFNLSFGVSTTTAFRLNSSLEAQLLDGVTNHRSGNGAIYIKSSGNGFNGFVSNGTSVTCPTATNLGLSCQNTAQDPMHIVPYIIGAAALNANGTASSYSTSGATNWISAPGGEFGEDISFAGSGNGQPAIMTTDQSSCTQGYTRADLSNPRNAFEDRGTHSLNTQCNYTSIFNGTSSAAPNVSGVVALMLAANNALTWRDVKHILATTARQVDASKTNIAANGIDIEPAWTTNAAGLTFHNVYGFGAIDAMAAVAAAQTYVANSLGTFNEGIIRSNLTAITVPDLAGATSVINEPDAGTVEFVRVEIFANHSFPSDWTIALTSPSGTRSVLLPAFNAYRTWPSGGFELGSNAFYGEPQQGNWTLELFDHESPDVGTLTSWSIRIYGH